MNCIQQFRVNIKVSFKGWALRAFLFALCLSKGTFSSFKTVVYAGSVKRKNPTAVEKRIDRQQTDYTKTKILVKFKKDAHPKKVLQELGIISPRVKRTLGDNTLTARERKYLRQSKSKKTVYKVQGKKYLSLDKVPKADLARAAYNRLPEKEKSLFRWYTVTLAGKEKDIPGLIEKIKRHPGVENAQPNYTYIPYCQFRDPYYSSSGSWGQDYPDLWNVHKINAASAWAIPVRPGPTRDINRDGIVNFFDYSLVASNLGNIGAAIKPKGADINEDGVVDRLDLRLIFRDWISASSLPGAKPDFNVNGIVKFLDVNPVAKYSCKCGEQIDPIAMDINQDGVADYKDIANLPQRRLRRSHRDSVVVAVVDTGLDYNHRDIFDNVWVNPGEVADKNGDRVIDLCDLDLDGDRRISENELSLASDGVDGDDNGLTDDLIGWNFNREWDDIPPDEVWQYGDYNDVSGNNNPMDTHGHGTHVSGTIAAVGNNNEGIIGVAPESRIMAIRADPMTDENLVYALYYAARNGARVINNSWGPQFGGMPDPVLEDTMEVLAEEYDCVVVFAAGNNNHDVAWYSPNNHKKVITVSSTDTDDDKSDFSNYGSLIDVAAPGGNNWEYPEPNTPFNELFPFVNILSLSSSRADYNDPYLDLDIFIVGNGYRRNYGTSMAAPAVSGLAALLRQHYPQDSWEDIRWRICLGSDDVGSMGKDINTGWGRINCYNSLFVERQPVLTISDIEVSEVAGDFDGKIEVGETAGVVVTVKNEWKDAFSVSGMLSCDHSCISIVGPSVDFGDILVGDEANNVDMPLTFKVTHAFSMEEYDPSLEFKITSSNGKDRRFKIPVNIIQINTQLIHDLSPNHMGILTYLTADGEGNVYLKWNARYNTNGDPNILPRGFHVSRDSGYSWDWLMPQTDHLWGDSIICDSVGNLYIPTHTLEDEVGVYSSHDRGVNWDIATFDDRPNSANQFVMADGIGGVYFFSWQVIDSRIRKGYFNYTHDGYNWSTDQTNPFGDDEDVYGIHWYDMTVDYNGNLYFLWFDWTPEFSLAKINRSLDRGMSWQDLSTVIGTFEDSYRRGEKVVSDDFGHVYVLWQTAEEVGEYSYLSKIFYNYSHDYGTSWNEEPLLIYSRPSEGRYPDDVANIHLFADNVGNVYFIATHDRRHPVIFMVSRNHGQTWSDARNITKLKSGALSADVDYQGRIGVLFVYNSDDVYFTYSNDYGETWSNNIRLGWARHGIWNVKVVTDGRGIFNCIWIADGEQIYSSTIFVPTNDNP